jgi:hypothetical protein
MYSTTRRAAQAALFTVSLLGGTACSDAVASSPLENAYASPEALAEAAITALVAHDEEALAALAIGRDEYETLLWPELPDGQHVTFEFVWGMSQPRTRKARRNQLRTYEGIPLEVVRVELGEEKEVYDSFTLHKDSRLWVRNTESGEEGLIPLMDVLVEMGGAWKFLNFRDDI